MNNTYLSIDSDSVRDKIHSWWRGLSENRGDSAELQRCHDLTEVFFCQAFHRLYMSLLSEGTVRREALALIAVSLAHVKEDISGVTFAQQMGESKSVQTPQISQMRFRKLIRCESYSELFLPVTRIIKMLNGAVNIDDVVKKLYFWNEKSRKDMTFEYFEKVLQSEGNQGGKKNE
ncbi:type I-E CRISPR-associated protein Cse2/CasB [Methanospirillum sp. J.3.6.1-F.2.7.3]|uniref:Type I-E CRISPR-associated protein Cse2/CasB n=1 Tax=Methanospirillum purgamenti TaxID=2834276 RepID=A0A8E7AZA8_9EURY|nr:MULTISPECIES: type I-E CRISPR-associated protein Cse2/CasB [Methanospirillum]MDX8551210.1 type I-E CRISPR-associated protein Cse2/CasB [Methanospirillum hungatei]QVV88178.1 type I-E CRISPR-associated protein Cse2/CasB [Methanospirillum sp. J.3.6.1-F.2.7.3]